MNIQNMIIEKDKVTIKINTKIFSMQAIFSAAYSFLDKAFIILDGNPKKEVLVLLKRKDKKKNLKELARDFNNELITYEVYQIQSDKNRVVRDTIVQKAISIVDNDSDDNYQEDPLDIAKPWSEEKNVC